jgi:hypothetical protein
MNKRSEKWILLSILKKSGYYTQKVDIILKKVDIILKKVDLIVKKVDIIDLQK